MRRAKAVGRFGMLAVGLGIGAVLTATAGTASANTSDNPFSFFPDPAAGVSTPALFA